MKPPDFFRKRRLAFSFGKSSARARKMREIISREHRWYPRSKDTRARGDVIRTGPNQENQHTYET
jgi:hypothetical protein